MTRLWPIVLVFMLGVSAVFGEDEYGFDEKDLEKETEKRPYHLGGFAELRPVMYRLDRDASLYKLNYYNAGTGSLTEEYNGRAQLDGSVEYGRIAVFAKGSLDGSRDYEGTRGEAVLYEGYLSLSPSDSFRVNAGKESLKWGKGYAWNPASFITRQRNPDDPELDLEGYYLARLEFVKSMGGPLKTVSFTQAALPVYDHVNEDYAGRRGVEAVSKLYLLLFDTDLDLIYSYGRANRSRFGFDFSRNLGSDVEIHGEAAYLTHAESAALSGAGGIITEEKGAAAFLAGIRYLTVFDTTCILEYYHNGAGRDENVMERFYASVDSAYDYFKATGDDGPLRRIADGAGGPGSKANPMTDYLYFRVVQKDPFGILYWAPAVTWIYNITDSSYSLSPEIAYTGVTNLEVRLKAMMLTGRRSSEFGEKAADAKGELRVRYSF